MLKHKYNRKIANITMVKIFFHENVKISFSYRDHFKFYGEYMLQFEIEYQFILHPSRSMFVHPKKSLYLFIFIFLREKKSLYKITL